MKVVNNPDMVLTLEDIEAAILEYVDRHIPEALDKHSSNVTFGLIDIGNEDDNSPYIPVYKLNSAKVKLNYLA